MDSNAALSSRSWRQERGKEERGRHLLSSTLSPLLLPLLVLKAKSLINHARRRRLRKGARSRCVSPPLSREKGGWEARIGIQNRRQKEKGLWASAPTNLSSFPPSSPAPELTTNTRGGEINNNRRRELWQGGKEGKWPAFTTFSFPSFLRWKEEERRTEREMEGKKGGGKTGGKKVGGGGGR